jgi:hypothetical protein
MFLQRDVQTPANPAFSGRDRDEAAFESRITIPSPWTIAASGYPALHRATRFGSRIGRIR